MVLHAGAVILFTNYLLQEHYWSVKLIRKADRTKCWMSRALHLHLFRTVAIGPVPLLASIHESLSSAEQQAAEAQWI